MSAFYDQILAWAALPPVSEADIVIRNTVAAAIGGGGSVVAAPASPDAAGDAGSLAVDENYIYAKNATKWIRAGAAAEWS